MTLFTRSSKEQETWNFISTVNLPSVVFSRRLIFYDQEHEKKSCSSRKTSLKKCGSFDVPCRTRKTLRKDLSVAYAQIGRASCRERVEVAVGRGAAKSDNGAVRGQMSV